MRRQNELRNQQYKTYFLALPLLSIPIYLPTLFNSQTSLLSILSISSLLSTAWLLYSLPAGITGIKHIDNLNKPEGKGPAASQHGNLRLGTDSPTKQYLPYLNLALCGVLALAGLVVKANRDILWSGFGSVPAAVYVMVLIAKIVMASVDVGELEALKYGYKGA